MSRKLKDISIEELRSIINESNNITEALKKCNLSSIFGRVRSTFKSKCLKGGLSDEFNQLRLRSIDYSLRKSNPKRKHAKEDILKKDCQLNPVTLRLYVRKNKLLENKCSLCGLEPHWNNKPLTLQLDHINGVNNDNRIENLRMLCPNCHSQTETYASRKLKLPDNHCLTCGGKISRKSKQCRYCSNNIENISSKKSLKAVKYKTNWPSDEELKQLVWSIPRVQLKKQLGVSDVAIARYCKRRNIEQPPRGYWSKKKYTQ